MQDRLKKNEKILNQFKNVLRRIGRLRLKQGQKTNLFKTKKTQEALKVIFKKKIKFIKKKSDILKNAFANIQKRKRVFEKGLKKIKNAKSFTKWI